MPDESRKKLKVVVDTNVFVSGLTFKGKPREVLDLVWRGEIDACIFSFILRELEDTLKKDFGWDRDQIKNTTEKIKTKILQTLLTADTPTAQAALYNNSS